MPNFASQFSTNKLATATSHAAAAAIVNEYFIDVTAAQLVLNNIFDIGVIPAGHKVTDMVLVPDDLDTNGTPLIALDVGVMSGIPGDTISARTSGNEFFSLTAAAQTGVPVRMSSKSGFTNQATGADRSIGVKVATAPATAAAGRIRLLVTMVSSDTQIAL